MLLKDDHEEKRRKSIKRERRKVREKGGKGGADADGKHKDV